MSDGQRRDHRPVRPGGFGGGPMGGAMGRIEKPKNFKATMQQLVKYLSPYRFPIMVVIIFAFGSAAFSIAGPKILGKATTKIFQGLVSKVNGAPGAGIDFHYVGNILLWLIGLYLTSGLFMFIQGFIMSGVAQKVSYKLRREIAEKINRLPLSYFDKTTHGQVLSRVTNDVDTVSQTLNQSMSQIITSVTTIIGVLAMMLSISWQMTLVVLGILPISMVLTIGVVKTSQKYFKAQQEYLGHVNGQVEEIYGGHIIMKAFNGEEAAIKEFKKLNHHLYDSAWRSQFLSGMLMPIMMFVGNLGYVAVSLLGGWYTIKNVIEVGDILSFIQYVRSFTQPISQIAQISNVLQSTAAAAERVFEFLAGPNEITETTNPLRPDQLRGAVTFDHVRFGYNPERIIIKDFSARIQPGQRIAIVGPTGAGKTTIVKLLMRFYELNSGAILIDGQDIKSFTRKDLRKVFGMVLQDTWLFNGTIMENIRYGNLKASEEDIINAAKLAHAHSFIKALPNGYKMELNEEASNISQGQKQLLTIARAILANPKILILDEATSSVDTRTEILIQKAMENLMQARTSFVIAHRLSTIKDADLIFVMKDGDIVEQGNHEELLAAHGFYASIYYSQFEASDVS